ncbi:MAG: glycosyltransferase family 61 protein [Moraxellaceae bacterium]|nr:MAG: glycosyltransferase family 61 protein [Moraxellaceae bacterium]
MNSRYFIRYIIKKDFKIAFLQRLILKWLKKLEIRDIIWLDSLTSHQLHCLQSAKTVWSYPPQRLDKSTLPVKVSTPTLFLYRLHNIILNTHSSHFVAENNQIIMERVPDANLEYCNYSTGYIKAHNSYHGLYKRSAKPKNSMLFSRALYLGGNGIFNYYHWLIEIAPKLLQIKQDVLNHYDVTTIILDDSVKNIPSFSKILELFLSASQLNLNIIYQHKSRTIYVKELFYINQINNIVFNSSQVLSSPTFSCLCPELIHHIRTVCLNQLEPLVTSKTYPRKIFLARNERAVRAYNQTEIMTYFEQQGFTAVYLEQHDFLEQVRLFNHAEFIVGPSGAAWSNIIFCQPHIKAISWLPEQIAEFSVFSTLAQIVQCDLRFTLAQAEYPDNLHSGYQVSAKDLIQLYDNMKL